MTFDGIRVRHATLARASDDLGATARTIQGRLDALAHDLAPLSHQWSGEAQRSYQHARAQWDAAMAEMVELLAQVSTVVAESNLAYRAVDQRGASRFG